MKSLKLLNKSSPRVLPLNVNIASNSSLNTLFSMSKNRMKIDICSESTKSQDLLSAML